MNARASRGFTLLEVLVALGIAVALGYFLVRTTAWALRWTTIQAQRNLEHAAIDELIDRWRADEDSAWAIFTPPVDVNGLSNTDGHEVDFFTRDAKYQSYFWAYNYNPQAQSLTRYLYAAPNGSPIVDTTYSGITKFFAHTYPLTALADPSSRIYSPLYTGAALQPGQVRFYGAANPLIAGGNQITYVRVEGPTLARELQLSTQTAPTGFTIQLSYTPAPTATTSSALQAWPQYLELPMQGQALQASSIANPALSPCAVDQARAFTDSSFTKALINATPPPGAVPAGVSASTDSGGCVNFQGAAFANGMPNVALFEPGYKAPFLQANNNCGFAVGIAATYPGSQSGPQVQIVSKGVASPVQGCTVTWQDQNTVPSKSATIYEVAGCIHAADNSAQLVGVGSTCEAALTVPTQFQGDCGELPNPARVTSGPGAVTGNANSFTVTRTGQGTIIVGASWDEKWSDSTGRGCSSRTYNGTVTFSD